MNSEHEPLPPYDFTVTERFKCGVTNRDLYRTFMTGMDGSPMLSYADKLTPDEAWDLVHFVRALQTVSRAGRTAFWKRQAARKYSAPLTRNTVLCRVCSVPRVPVFGGSALDIKEAGHQRSHYIA